METIQYAKLNAELLSAIRQEDYLGSMHRKGTKCLYLYTYSIRLMRFLQNTRYGKAGEVRKVEGYGQCIALGINLSAVSQELLLELANIPHPKGWKHITAITTPKANQDPIGKSEYLYRDECNRFYVLTN